MKMNQLKAGSLLTYIQMGLGTLISLAFTPVMLSALGANEYGLYNTAVSTIAMLSILNLGFSSSYIRFFTQYRSTGDENGEAKLNGLYLIVFTCIGLVVLAVGLLLASHLEWVFSNGLTEQEYQIAKVLMILLVVNMAVSLPMTTFTSVISAHERFVFLKTVNCLRILLGPLCMLPVLLLGNGSIGMVIVTVAVNMMANACFAWYAHRKLHIRYLFFGFPKRMFRDILVFSSFIAMAIIVDQVNMNVDKVLLGRFRGTYEVAVYTIGFTLYTYFLSFSTAISSVFTPRIHKIVSRTDVSTAEQNESLSALFIRIGRIQFLIMFLLATALLIFGKPFITRWTGINEYTTSYYVLLLLVFPAIVPLCQNIGLEIQRAKNLHKFRSVAYLLMAAINIILSIDLCQRYGAIGSAAGTSVSLLVVNGLIMNIYYHRKIGIDIPGYWRQICRMLPGLLLPCAFGVVLILTFPINSYPLLALSILSYAVVYFISAWFLSMNNHEKGLVKSLLRHIPQSAAARNTVRFLSHDNTESEEE